MAHEQKTLSSLDVWRDLSPAERLSIATVFWQDQESVSQQVEAVQAMARQLNFRPQSILKLPPERRAKQLSAMARIPEGVAGRALVVYHLAAQRPMLEAFLDALGMPHDHGVIDDTPSEPPDPGRLKAAVAAVSASFPPGDVRVYLRTLAAQDPGVWHGLLDVIPEPSR